MDEIAIKVDDLTKIYKLYDKPSDRLKEALGLSKNKTLSKDHYALQNVSFDVKRGETIGIIGTNGSGKSTILKIITGVLNPSGGSVTVNGRISALLELGAGFNQEYTGIENIYLNGTMIGFSREEITGKLKEILDFADIGDFVHQPVKTYSSGMFVRLAFAIAINIEPEILIVDEALSVGDVFFQSKCYRKFEEFKKMNKTILFVSHDLGSVSKYCDRVVLLDRGKKLSEGNPKEIVNLYKKVLVKQVNPTDVKASSVPKGDEAERSSGDLEYKTTFEVNADALEYGDKKGEIVGFNILDEYGVATNTIEKGSKFSIKVKMLFNEHVEEPISAFSIKDIRGTEITGTNTMYEEANIGPKDPGDTLEVMFTQEMNLQGGEYMLSLGCTGYSAGDFTVYHRLYDICNITVVSVKNTVGYYDMNSKVEILGSNK